MHSASSRLISRMGDLLFSSSLTPAAPYLPPCTRDNTIIHIAPTYIPAKQCEILGGSIHDRIVSQRAESPSNWPVCVLGESTWRCL